MIGAPMAAAGSAALVRVFVGLASLVSITAGAADDCSTRRKRPICFDRTRAAPAMVKALARAFRWKRMLDDGRYASIGEIAAAEKDRPRLCRQHPAVDSARPQNRRSDSRWAAAGGAGCV